MICAAVTVFFDTLWSANVGDLLGTRQVEAFLAEAHPLEAVEHTSVIAQK